MNKYIIASCIIAITLGVQISLDNTCSCGDYVQSTECTGRCWWNTTSTKCVDFPCSTYNAATNCTSNVPQQTYCYWTGTACNKFTTCGALSGNTTTCPTQNPGCSWAAGSNCIAKDACATFTPATCPVNCQNATTSCIDYTSCDQRKSDAACKSALWNACFWNATSTTCVANVCKNLGNSTASCISIQNGNTVIPCVYAESTGCVDADPKNLTVSLCGVNTANLYHWSKAGTETDGSCIACYAVIVQIMFAFILLLA